ncbi:MAG: glycosyltransferase family A protein [Cetobacterium sp.]
MSKLISIIVPIYNKEKYIREMLDSLRDQENTNFEVIFINDGSTDNSEEVLKKNEIEYNFKYRIISKKNEGVSITRNLGLKEAEGEYIYFLDADDSIESTFVSELQKILKNRNDNIIWFGYDRYIRKKDEICLLKKYEEKYKYCSEFEKEKTLKKFLKKEIHIHICSILFNKKFLDEKQIKFIEGKSYAEDQAFVIEALSKTEKIFCLDKSLFKYIETPNSAINTMSIKKLETLDVFFIILISDWMKEQKIMKQKITIDATRMLISYYFKYKGPKIDNYLLNFKDKIIKNKMKFSKKQYILLIILLKIGELLKK